MKRLASLILLLSAAACAKDSASAGAALPADFAALVPADAVAVVQLRSARELADRIGVFAYSTGQKAPSAESLLAEILSAAQFPGKAGALDLDRPIGLAVSQGASVMQPVLTFVLPAKDPQAFAADVAAAGAGAGMSAAVQGNYVALRLGKGAAAAGEPGPMLADFPAGLISVRADLATLLVSYRPFIDIGLAGFEQMIESGALQDPELPSDMTAVFEWYLEVIRGVLDSAERLDLALDWRGERASVDFRLLNKEGSMLANLSDPARVDYAALAGRVDPTDAVFVVMNYSQAEMYKRFESLYDGIVQELASLPGADPALVAVAQEYFKATSEFAALVGKEFAASYDFGEQGVEIVAEAGAEDPAAMVAALMNFVRSPALAEIGLELGPEVRGELAGQPAIQWTQRFQLDEFRQHLPDASITAEEEAAFGRLAKTLTGGDGLEIALLPASDRVRLIAGGDAAWREAAAERFARNGAVDAEFRRRLEVIEGANPAMYAHVSFARILEIVVQVGQAFGEASEEFEGLKAALATLDGQPLRFDLHWGVRGREMFAGFGMDAGALAQLLALDQGR